MLRPYRSWSVVIADASASRRGPSLNDPRTILLCFLFAIGACTGSFLNVVAWRLPRACMSVARPRSRCPRCTRVLPWYENIPILSWVVLRGRCRGCRLPIGVRYPAVELATGAVFVLIALELLPGSAFTDVAGHGALWLSWAVFALVASALIALSLIDLDYRILPDSITLPGAVLGPVLAFLAPESQHGQYAFRAAGPGEWAYRIDGAVNGAAFSLICAGLLFGIGWIGSRVFRKPAMGLGDVKMIAAMGAFQGAWALLALMVASVAGAVIGVAARLATRSRYIPFGPFLALGMFTVLLWGPEILQAYVDLFQRR